MIDVPPPAIYLDPPAFVVSAPSGGSPVRVVAEAATVGTDASATVPADPPLALGLSGIADWTPQQPFLDVMKTARPWTGHLHGQWGGWGQSELEAGGWLDAAGWPKGMPPEVSSLEAIILTVQPEEADWIAGRYRLTYAGEGTIELSGRVANVVRRPGEISFDFTPGEGLVGVQIAATDPRGTGEYIRDIAVVKEEYRELHEAGGVFNPRWLTLVEDVRSLRFMDWMGTNNSPSVTWDDRPRPADYTWGWRGVPVEVMVELANETATDPWFTMPHAADDGYFRGFAEYVRDHLDPGRKAYVEYSNEVWNWIFDQAGWLRDRAGERWGIRDGDGWLQYAGMRAAAMADAWDAAFGDEAEARLVKVIATMTAWHGLEVPILEAPLWVAEDPARNAPPVTRFDAYAVTGYFGNQLGGEKAPAVREWIAESRARAEAEADSRGLQAAARAAYLAEHGDDAAIARAARELRDAGETGTHSDYDDSVATLTKATFPYQAGVARNHGLDLVMYEGGTHVAGVGPAVDDEELGRFFIRLNYSPEMGELYRELMSGWREVGGTLFNAFVDVAGAGPFGSWGNLRHLQDSTPRWDALMDYNRTAAADWETRPPGSFENGGLMEGGAGPDRIEGGPHRDILLGKAGNDTLSGGGGDRIHGGLGEDTAVLPGRRADYAFRREGPSLVADGPGGSARLVAVEQVSFSDDAASVPVATLP